ncbi:hypothetical protein Hanom_Chr15g01393861 [Helianthus anomalus]
MLFGSVILYQNLKHASSVSLHPPPLTLLPLNAAHHSEKFITFKKPQLLDTADQANPRPSLPIS